MNAKEYLNKASWLDKRIDNKLEQLETLKSIAMKVTTDTTKERVMGGNNSKSSMESIMVKVIDLQHEINNDIDNLVDMKVKINKWIENLKDINQQLVLEMRYLNRMSWETIATQLNYSQRTIFSIHKKGLIEIEKVCSKFQ